MGNGPTKATELFIVRAAELGCGINLQQKLYAGQFKSDLLFLPWYVHFRIGSWLGRVHRSHHGGKQWLDEPPTGFAQYDDGNLAVLQILLITNVLI